MKARILITAALIITMGAAQAATPASLVFKTNNGKELVQPVRPEDTEEALPLEVRQEIEKTKSNQAGFHFDITSYIQPEEEEPLPFDLNTEFLKARIHQAESQKHAGR